MARRVWISISRVRIGISRSTFSSAASVNPPSSRVAKEMAERRPLVKAMPNRA